MRNRLFLHDVQFKQQLPWSIAKEFLY